MTPVGPYTAAAPSFYLPRSVRKKTEEHHMGIEPILSAWKAEVLAIIRMVHKLDTLLFCSTSRNYTVAECVYEW